MPQASNDIALHHITYGTHRPNRRSTIVEIGLDDCLIQDISIATTTGEATPSDLGTQ